MTLFVVHSITGALKVYTVAHNGYYFLSLITDSDQKVKTQKSKTFHRNLFEFQFFTK